MAKWFFQYALSILVGSVVGIALVMLFNSCASQIAPATSSIGTVLQVDGDRVLVTFPVVTHSLGSQSANWFYIPGHGYQVRDKYPDPNKDPNLRKP